MPPRPSTFRSPSLSVFRLVQPSVTSLKCFLHLLISCYGANIERQVHDKIILFIQIVRLGRLGIVIFAFIKYDDTHANQRLNIFIHLLLVICRARKSPRRENQSRNRDSVSFLGMTSTKLRRSSCNSRRSSLQPRRLALRFSSTSPNTSLKSRNSISSHSSRHCYPTVIDHASYLLSNGCTFEFIPTSY